MKRPTTLATLLFLFVGVISLIAAGQGAQRQGSITGRLTTESGQAIANVGVFVRRVGSQTSVTRNVATDEDGRFHADDLPPGSYTVSAFTPGYVPATESEQPPTYRAGDSVTMRYTRGGVITGTVTNAQGEPVVGVRVAAARVRDSLGRVMRPATSGNSRVTDDRGVFRLFGLSTGTYIVQAGGGAAWTSIYGSAFDGDAPTYYPSTTRDAAGEVSVRAGDETTGIDIRYRADQGYAISGTLSGTALSSTKSPMALIYLMHQSTGSMVSNTVVQVRDGARGFALTGVPDGEYDLVAQLNQTAGEDNVASLPRRVTVKGADVTGLSVELAPLGSITGRVVIEKLSESSAVAECKERVGGTLDETLISARRDEPPGKALAPFGFPSPEAGIDQSGEFKISSLTPARYRIGTRLPSEHWYVRTILGPGAGTKPSTAVSSQGISLSSGQRVTGLVVTIAEGAAAVRGKVTQPSANSPLPERVRIYLVPAEPESADDLLRYAEADVEASGVYLFTNIAPGKYYVLAREPAGEQITERNARPLAWDAAARVSLRQQATSVNQVIELGQCQRIVDREVRFTQSPGGTQRPRRPRPPS